LRANRASEAIEADYKEQLERFRHRTGRDPTTMELAKAHFERHYKEEEEYWAEVDEATYRLDEQRKEREAAQDEEDASQVEPEDGTGSLLPDYVDIGESDLPVPPTPPPASPLIRPAGMGKDEIFLDAPNESQ